MVLKHIEFVRLEPQRALAVLVGRTARSRTASCPAAGADAPSADQACNYLARIRGRTLAEARAALERAREPSSAELDELTQKLVEAGLATLSGGDARRATVIVRGRANLINDPWRRTISSGCGSCSTSSKSKGG